MRPRELNIGLILELLEKWAAEHPTPSEPVLYVPDSPYGPPYGLMSPKQIVEQARAEIETGDSWICNILAPNIEAVLLNQQCPDIELTVDDTLG